MEPSAPPQGDRVRVRHPVALLAALGALALALGATSVWFGLRLIREPLPVLGQLPDFSLVAQDGRPVSLESLSGRLWVADFIFTRCAGQCPAMTMRMSRLRGQLPEDVRFVSFTVDPGYDTPQVLAAYASNLKPGDRWLFLTGPQADLYDLATHGFHLTAMEVPPDQQGQQGDGPFVHSARFVLVDREARLRGYYDSTDSDAIAHLIRDVKTLL